MTFIGIVSGGSGLEYGWRVGVGTPDWEDTVVRPPGVGRKTPHRGPIPCGRRNRKKTETNKEVYKGK